MPLDDLVRVIETLQQRIRDHGDSLRQNEIRTRVALIDPLLTALGWDVADPGMVTAEYDVGGRRADYALLGTGNIPAATVEAKKLNESLEPHRLQMLNYSNAAGIRFAGLTDGNRWEFYEIFKQGTLDERRILEAVISSESSAHLALRFLLLWQSNMETGRPVDPRPPIIKEVPAVIAETSETHSGTDQRVQRVLRQPQSTEGWHRLSSLEIVPGDASPTAIRFPTGDEYQIRIWRQLVEITLSWLWDKGFLSQSDVPVRSSGKRFLVNLEPKHPTGNEFKTVCSVPGTPLYIDGNISAKASASNAKRILQHCGQDPASVSVKVN